MSVFSRKIIICNKTFSTHEWSISVYNIWKFNTFGQNICGVPVMVRYASGLNIPIDY